MSETVTVTCPHCGTNLTVDTAAGVVVAHAPPVTDREKIDFDARLKQIEDDKKRAADRMAEAMRMEKSRGRIIEDKFRKLMNDARDAPDDGPPIKDIDLD